MGLRFLNLVIPAWPVLCVANGVPGRGLDDDFGVDSSTETSAAGVARRVTEIVAVLSDGFGVSDGTGVGVTVPELLWHAGIATANETAARRIMTRLGMAGSLRRGRAPLRFLYIASIAVRKKRSDFAPRAA